MSEMKEEIKSINSKVLAFGLITIAAVLAVFCIIMAVAFFVVAGKYVAKSETVLEQSDVILTLQRSLDRTEGRLTVYETYLTNRNVDIVRSLISRFLRKEKRKSTIATIKDFEEFLGVGCSVCPSHAGPGGGK